MQLKKLFTLLAFVGLTASASAQEVTFKLLEGKNSNWATNQQTDKLFDGTPLKWCANTGGLYFVFEASESVILSGYTIVTGNDNATYNGRNPYKWTLYGMNAPTAPSRGTTGWEPIHNMESGDDTMADLNYQAYRFALDGNNVSYKYYKMEISAVKGASSNVIQIGEFIPETKITTVNVGEKDNEGNYIVTYNGGTASDTSYENAVDGSPTTGDWLGFTWDGNGIVFDSGSSNTVLKSYAFHTIHDQDSYSERTPVSWKWYGSNAGSRPDASKGGRENWTTVDEDVWTEIAYVNRDMTLYDQKVNGYRQLYFVNNGTAYRYYKLIILECDPKGKEALGGQWGGMFGLSEIEINPVCEHTNYIYQIAPSNQTTTVCSKCGKTTITTEAPTDIAMIDGKASWNLGSERSNKNVTYTRSISSDRGTVCLPYALDVSTKTDNATYYTLGRYDDVNDVLYFDEVTRTLPARTPAIYVRGESVTSLNLNANSVTLPVSDNSNPSVDAARGSNDWKMIGTVKSGTASESSNSIFYLKGGSFYRCNDHISYKPYRAYITGPADATPGVKAFGIADDMEDAINSLTETEDGEIQLYDLSGRKVNDIRTGEIYIMNGRKIMFNK